MAFQVTELTNKDPSPELCRDTICSDIVTLQIPSYWENSLSKMFIKSIWKNLSQKLFEQWEEF